ncbi:SCO2583/SCO2584 N-terminal domain-containing protein [Streptomyces viridosporus]|uniref:SCO2583/SCO2584 N-terminal domain-containing protein n=1 Tax=Streptomyces viridosporus TaxID=67581 RepID=UPI00370036E8
MTEKDGGRGRDEQDDVEQREFDLRWADGAEYKEPSARARMLAARWKDNPPGPVPFRPDPEHTRSSGRSSWVSTAVVLGCVVAVILFLGYIDFRPH